MGGHFTETIRHVSRSVSQLPIPGPEVSSGARASRFLSPASARALREANRQKRGHARLPPSLPL